MSRSWVSRVFRVAVGAVMFAAAVSLPSAQQGGRRVNVLITFDRTPGAAEQALVNGLGGQIRYSYTLVPGMAASLPESAVGALGNNPRVRAIEPDGEIFGHDAELNSAWGVKRIGSGDAHAAGTTGQGVTIGVMDSGIDYTHSDLDANYDSSRSHNFVNNTSDPFDDNSHGSHVSGTAAAEDDNSGVVGVAPGATIVALKVLNDKGSGAWSSVIAALEWARNHGVDVTNGSFGSGSNPGTLVEAAYDAAWAAGIVNVGSAGNSGNCAGNNNSVGYPARFSSVIAVAATSSNDSRPCFSSTGPDVELAAPGVSIVSTVPGGGYASYSGTSMASPHVAGVAALLLSAGVADANHDGRTNDEVRNILTSTAIDLGPTGRDTLYGFGLVNVVAALAALEAGAEPAHVVNVALSTDKPSYVVDEDQVVTLTAVVSDENGSGITGLGAGDFTTTLDGQPIAAEFGPSGGGAYVAVVALPAGGNHTVSVVVDDGSAIGNDSTSFNVQNPAAFGLGQATVTYAGSGGKNRDKHLLVTVLIVDSGGQPVANASVAVDVSRNGTDYASNVGTTGSTGEVTFQLTNAPAGTYDTSVTSVTVGGVMYTGVTTVGGVYNWKS